MKVKILRGTIVNGKPAFPDEVIEVNAATGKMLVRSGKAALVEETLTPLNNVAPNTSGAMGESETEKVETDSNDPLGLNPTGGLNTKSAKPITRAEKR